jgi:hypothetical protein
MEKATMDSLPDKLPTRRRKAVWLVVSIAFVILLACLGLISSKTTMGLWDGMFPSGEYHLKIQDKNGRPINGATLKIFEGGTKNVAFEYPIDNYLSEGSLVSNEQGVIVVLHKPRGFEFGGTCWSLYWVFPRCSDGPEFDFQISADGYKSINFSTHDLFEPAYNDRQIGYTTIELESGESLRIPVFELMFTLER